MLPFHVLAVITSHLRAFHTHVHLTIVAITFLILVSIVLKDLSEVINADELVTVFVCYLVEDALFMRLNSTELQLLKNVSESSHG